MHKTVIHTPLEFLKWWQAHRQPVMSLDTETTSLDYLEMELEGFSLCNGTHSCYVQYDNHEWVLAALKDVVDYLDVTVMHNAVFDLKVLHKYNTEPKKIWCTLTAAKLLNENRGKGEYGLKSLAVSVLEIPEEQIKKWEEVEVGTPEFYDYAINDAVWTYMLYEQFLPMLVAQDLIHLFEVVEMPFQHVLSDLERNGVLIDKEILHQFKPQVENILFKLEVLMLAEIGMEHDVHSISGEIELVSPINLNSSQQLVGVAEGILGLKITERTRRSKKFPKGQPSVDKFTIARLAPKSEFFTLLSRYRKLGTLHRTFLNPCEHFIGLDGHIRASYQMIRTGRLSCSRPNLQNLPNPKKEKLEFNHRLMFIPAAGHVFVKADWAGQELRVLAEESQDERMIQAFIDCKDLHLMTANSIFDLQLTDEQLTATSEAFKKAKAEFATERHRAKNGVNFPIIYGKSVKTLATDFDITVEEAQRWMDAFHGLYPNVQKAIDITRLELQEHEFVVTMMGRRRRFPGYNQMSKWEKAAALRQAFNFKIQGFSAEMMKLAGSRIRLIIQNYDARIVLTIHDELIYEVLEQQATAFAVEVKHIMEHVVSLSIPIVVDVSIVNSYGD
jgi:DNA polymerase-1